MSTAKIEIYTEGTPNPASVKFIVNKNLVTESVDFPDAASSEGSAFAYELFRFSFVKAVFFASNFITITKADGVSWDEISPILLEFIKGAVESEVEIQPHSAADTAGFTGTETEIKIQQVLESYVKPAVEQDGGAIHFKSFNEGVVSVILKGSCSGCPSSTITLKAGIENLLKRLVPEVTEVVAEAM